MKKTISFAISIFLLCFVLGCKDKNAPPKEVSKEVIPPLQSSYISLPVSISTVNLEKGIRDALPSPAVTGQSPPISVKLLATEPITAPQMVKEMVSPYIPAHMVTTYKQETVSVKQTFRSLIHFKFKDVVKYSVQTITIPITAQIPAQEAVYRFVSRPVTNIIDKIYPVSATVHYNLYVNDLHITMTGNKLNVAVSTRTNISIDYTQPVVPLGPNVTIKGALNCDILNDLTIAGTVDINDQLGLDVNLSSDDTQLDFKKFCAPFAVQGLDLVANTNPAWFAYKKLITKIVHDQMLKMINGKVDKLNNNLNIQQRVAAYSANVNEPKEIKTHLWISPNVQEAFISGIDSYQQNGETLLRVNVGLKATPQITYNLVKPDFKAEKIDVKKAVTQNEVQVRLQLFLDYVSAADTLKKGLNAYLAKDLKGIPLKVADVEVYPSLHKLAFKVSFTFKDKDLANVYFAAKPAFNPDSNKFSADSVAYFLKSEVILDEVVNDIASKKILSFLQKHASWTLPASVINIRNNLKNLTLATDTGVLTANLNSTVDRIFVQKDNLTACVDFSGTIAYQAKELKPFKVNVASLSKSPAPVTLNTSAQPDGSTIILTKPGDAITSLNSKNQVITRLATFKDIKLKGDTIWYWLEKQLHYHVVSDTDLKKNVVQLK